MKPGDFYVGVLEFFAVLLPGSVLLGFLVAQDDISAALGLLPLANETARFAAFLLAAYALGHIVFLMASALDGLIYRHLREKIWADQPGDAFALADALRRAHVGGTASLPMNTFKWSQAYLLQNVPAAAAEVRRFESDSKFFRSLTLLLAILAGLLAWQGSGSWAVLAVALSIVCCWRYAEQRHKSTDTAYRHVVIRCVEQPFPMPLTALANRPGDP